MMEAVPSILGWRGRTINVVNYCQHIFCLCLLITENKNFSRTIQLSTFECSIKHQINLCCGNSKIIRKGQYHSAVKRSLFVKLNFKIAVCICVSTVLPIGISKRTPRLKYTLILHFRFYILYIAHQKSALIIILIISSLQPASSVCFRSKCLR